ncbi:hypothetical protein SAMN05421833_102135 [Microbispora rosea]|uniref:PknH-like extracellular domain-containing protein n=1 Tax=Microbispora rosea TaxID=58117 RepID=A0A1N6SW29_9ACTN|nr:hypothetical protein [Microbispora rosea]GIH45290.1 hypothetical protein Mro03_04690 [Microbispora rosea subsp. rosea]SIQ45340.1 hypothetical protein SAMN05421833_102135 [Microbispora rosea]
MRRVLTSVAAAAAVTVTATVTGASQAQAAPVARVTATAADASQASAPAVLPKGFLLNEAKVNGPRRPWEHLKLTDSLKKPLEVNPCGRRAARDGRSASRTFTYVAETVYRGEQVVLYPSERDAKAAMRSVRADLAECAARGRGANRHSYRWKSIGIGDEALRIGGFFFENRSRTVVVRRGSALAVYVRTGLVTKSLPVSQFRPLIKDARTMAAKLCGLPGVCRR